MSVKSLKRKKAAGYDKISSDILKDDVLVISGSLSFVINLSLSKGSVPSRWKIAKVVPLDKGGSHNEISNYRPISILPVISKILPNRHRT